MKREIELLIYLVIYHGLNCFADTQSKAGILWEMNLMDKETKEEKASDATARREENGKAQHGTQARASGEKAQAVQAV